MWALHVTGGLTEADLVALLDDASEYVRGWAITLLVETSASRPMPCSGVSPGSRATMRRRW